MAKKEKRIDKDINQLSLLDLLIKAQEDRKKEPGEGSLDIDARLKTALNEALKKCPLSRWEVAGKMSHLLGKEITKYQIDAWTAESKEHSIPGRYVPAFCVATKNNGPLEVINEPCGVYTLQGPDALRAEIEKDREREKKVKDERRSKEVLLKALEGKR